MTRGKSFSNQYLMHFLFNSKFCVHDQFLIKNCLQHESEQDELMSDPQLAELIKCTSYCIIATYKVYFILLVIYDQVPLLLAGVPFTFLEQSCYVLEVVYTLMYMICLRTIIEFVTCNVVENILMRQFYVGNNFLCLYMFQIYHSQLLKLVIRKISESAHILVENNITFQLESVSLFFYPLSL